VHLSAFEKIHETSLSFLIQNVGPFDVKRMLEGMRQQNASVSPQAAYCPQEHQHTATLKRKLAMRGKQLKAAKRKITAVSKEKAGLEQQLALREQKLKVRQPTVIIEVE
jgi:hypothetical protein